ncbi:MAG: phosphate ABC transporter permease [Moorea sp. SIO2B7]|nr:phosphate ABC transporter permease [Moorena sp. SIO2B7]
MLVPLTREKFEQIIPLIATGAQYAYYWGKVRDFLKRLLISLVAVVLLWLVKKFLGEGSAPLILLLQVIGGLYWLWAPVYWASMRNTSYRRFKYSGFWRGRVLDVFITEDLIGEEETVNKRGELVIVENRERRINLEIGDETGFTAEVQAPLRRIHKVITPGQIAELLVLSNQADLSRITKITDAYIPSHNLWVGEYPYLQRDVFTQVSRELGGKGDQRRPPSRRITRTKGPRRY